MIAHVGGGCIDHAFEPRLDYGCALSSDERITKSDVARSIGDWWHYEGPEEIGVIATVFISGPSVVTSGGCPTSTQTSVDFCIYAVGFSEANARFCIVDIGVDKTIDSTSDFTSSHVKVSSIGPELPVANCERCANACANCRVR